MVCVVKIGGSLFPEYLNDLYPVFQHFSSEIVLVNGGGDLANKIRDYNLEFNYSDDVNHWCAIRCMDILGKLICDKFDDIIAIKSFDEIDKVHKMGKIPLILAYELMRQLDPLEHSWDVSSDSIACWVASEINAKLLILTNINGIYNGDIYSANRKLIKYISANELLLFDETCVDKCLPKLLLKYEVDCFIINGKRPEWVYSFLDDNLNANDTYTLIGGK
ncbi:MAG: delta 1-pyrroline-5-carboxylate synthetase [Methanosphaera sp.]|uniref:amino acid kinase family protein n=1 Tax=Methanosphaera sp. TaxID=2666342 RepID=UPI0025D6B7DC|nr:delta 1-pyrroline-5-carboxylate synthetase [Methanosphaera sp.]MCI5867264.1 delta 1-pyrroline-5-carboxylate synthetase [Methanosphaera sp.]MDD6534668.1 delta 1-pyrroline-5-carboxylate synthetase [Methanosphaera sp.]MDY3955664.1 delta 1-pyrroline-5-carboxylate synthetase [Methanosphaera sp.]